MSYKLLTVSSAGLACVLGWAAVPARADEGMWLFSNPPRQQLKEKHDARLTGLEVGSEAANARAQATPVERELDRLRIPEKLVPKDKRPLFMVRAEGVQIYRAEEKGGKLDWVFQAPRATLLDYQTGEKAGTHSKEANGPIWLDAGGGKLTGKVLESNPALNPDAIPWLLLQVKNEGGGRYAKVTHIGRLDTWAGKPPAAAPAKAGETKEVRYQATYVFWGER